MDNPPNRPPAEEGGVDEMDTPDLQHPPADDQHPPADQWGVVSLQHPPADQEGGEPPAVERPSASTTMPRKRTPGRWRRITRWWTPPDHTPQVKEQMAEADLVTLKNIEFIRNMKEEDCDLQTAEDVREFHAFKEKMIRSLTALVYSKPEDHKVAYKRFSDTREEHLTAEGMEAYILPQFPESKRCQQAKHFAELALNHYNKKRTESRKFKLATTLLSNCFSERSGTTYGHVNFTAILEEKTATQPTSKTKRLFFAELMLVPKLQADPKAEPMRVVHVYVIDDDYCYGMYFFDTVHLLIL